MSFKSIAEKEGLEAELNAKGYATRQLPGLSQPKYGFYKKPNGEIVRLPIGPDRLQFYKAKGFEYLAPEGETTIEKLREREADVKVAPPEAEPKPKAKRTAKRKRTAKKKAVKKSK